MGCNCGSKAKSTVYVLSYEDGSGRKGGQYASRTDAEIADVRNGGGGVIRPVAK